MIKLMVKVGLSMQTVTFSLVIGRMTKQKARDNTIIWMVLNMTDHGLLINKMVEELNSGQMVLSIVVFIKTAKRMDKAAFCGPIYQHIMVDLSITTLKVMESTSGMMEDNMMDSG